MKKIFIIGVIIFVSLLNCSIVLSATLGSDENVVTGKYLGLKNGRFLGFIANIKDEKTGNIISVSVSDNNSPILLKEVGEKIRVVYNKNNNFLRLLDPNEEIEIIQDIKFETIALNIGNKNIQKEFDNFVKYMNKSIKRYDYARKKYLKSDFDKWKINLEKLARDLSTTENVDIDIVYSALIKTKFNIYNALQSQSNLLELIGYIEKIDDNGSTVFYITDITKSHKFKIAEISEISMTDYIEWFWLASIEKKLLVVVGTLKDINSFDNLPKVIIPKNSIVIE